MDGCDGQKVEEEVMVRMEESEEIGLKEACGEEIEEDT